MWTSLRLALLPLLFTACGLAAAQATYFPSLGGVSARLPIASLQATRMAGTVRQEYDFSCGSAALATLLSHHYGHDVSEEEVLQQMYAVGDQQKIQAEGFSMLDMKRYLKGIGFEADGFEQPLDKLIQAGLPAIVLINEGSYHHFVVVKGMRGDTLLVGDPARGVRTVTRRQFESVWVGGMLFVIHNRTTEARFNLAAEWRTAPRAPLSSGVPLEGVAGAGLTKYGPGDF